MTCSHIMDLVDTFVMFLASPHTHSAALSEAPILPSAKSPRPVRRSGLWQLSNDFPATASQLP